MASGFDPTNPFAEPAGAKPVVDAFNRLAMTGSPAADPFQPASGASDPFGAAPPATDPFREPAAANADFANPFAQPERGRTQSSPFASFGSGDPFATAPPVQQRASVAAVIDPFAAISTRPSVSDTGVDLRVRSESVTIFGARGGATTGRRAEGPGLVQPARTNRKDLDLFDPLAPTVDLFDPLAPTAPSDLAAIHEVPAPVPAPTFTSPIPDPFSAPVRTVTPPPVPTRTSPVPSAPATGSPASINDKYTVGAVLQGLDTQKQTIVVGSTAKEERLDAARGLDNVQYLGYRGYLGYSRLHYSSTDKREFRVKKSPQSAIRITLTPQGVSVCKCPTECGPAHKEVGFVAYKELKRLRHVQTDSKKGFHYLALETKDGETFVIYSQQSKMIKAGINTRYNAVTPDHEEQQSDPTPAATGNAEAENRDMVDPFAGALDSERGGEDPFAPSASASGAAAAAEQKEWWR